MPLAAAQPDLTKALEALATTPGATVSDCAGQWADAISAFMGHVVPVSTTATAGKAALRGALATAFAKDKPADVATAMDNALTTYATTVGAGMTGAGFTGAAPVTPVGFAQLFVPPYVETHSAAAAKVSARLLAWAVAGVATALAGGATSNWT